MSAREIDTAAVQVDLNAEFRVFYDATSAGLFGAMCLVTGNRADAEELTQESYLKVWERWDRIRGMDNPTGYLYRTAMNAFRMRHRRAVAAARRVVRSVVKSTDLDVFEAKFEIDRGLATLTPRQRAAVVLTELLDLSSVESAEMLGVKPATVRKLAQQGRDRLRRTIGENDA